MLETMVTLLGGTLFLPAKATGSEDLQLAKFTAKRSQALPSSLSFL